eukprot:INCI16318.3.p1 GENE.INCI16318.3~~INCI16318.3.p1  ORF type:complete len:351 (-),score=63.08 INCI16318.3:343-1395(-)
MMESGEDIGGYSPMHDGGSGDATSTRDNLPGGGGGGSEYAGMSSAARAAMLLRLGAGGDSDGYLDNEIQDVDDDDDDVDDDNRRGGSLEEITIVDHTHKPATTTATGSRSSASVSTRKASAEEKPLALWKLCRDGDSGQLRLMTPEAEGGAAGKHVEVEVLMPPLKKRIAMNLSLSEQPHNGIFVNGSRVEGEPLVGTKGTEFEWGQGASRTELKIMATKKVPFAHGCDHETRYLLFINGREARSGKMEARFWWEINFRLVVIGLVGILIFILSLGLSFIPSLGSIGSMLFRVTVILALVGLYELIVGLVSLSKLHGSCDLKCLCPPRDTGAVSSRATTQATAQYETFER